MDIDQVIADFLKDAQFRIAEIGVELDNLADMSSEEYQILADHRLQLSEFIGIIYVGQWNIIDGYNLLDWDDYDIQQESEYLRTETGMINSPFTTFSCVYPQIVNNIVEGDGAGLPVGDPGDFIYYNTNGEPVTVQFPRLVGMQSGDTVQSYFA